MAELSTHTTFSVSLDVAETQKLVTQLLKVVEEIQTSHHHRLGYTWCGTCNGFGINNQPCDACIKRHLVRLSVEPTGHISVNGWWA